LSLTRLEGGLNDSHKEIFLSKRLITLFIQIEEEIEEVMEYDLNVNNNDVKSDDVKMKKVVATKTLKPTTISSTPIDAFRGDIDFVLADLSQEKEKGKVPFPEFGVDIVFRKGAITLKKIPLARMTLSRASLSEMIYGRRTLRKMALSRITLSRDTH
jgi:hypothetical protein